MANPRGRITPPVNTGLDITQHILRSDELSGLTTYTGQPTNLDDHNDDNTAQDLNTDYYLQGSQNDDRPATPLVNIDLQPQYIEEDLHLDNNKLNILSWNIGGILQHAAQLQKCLETNKYDVIALQEIRCCFAALNKIRLEDYNIFAQASSRPKHRQGLLIAVRKTIPAAYRIKTDDISPFEKLVVRVDTPNGNIDIVNLYLSPSQQREFTFMSKKHPNNPNTIYVGDFNTNHSTWSNRRNHITMLHERAHNIIKDINDNNLHILNLDKTPTTQGRNVYDLAIATTNVAARADTKVIEHMCGDRHYPLSIHLNVDKHNLESSFQSRYKLEATNWETYAEGVDKILEKHDTLSKVQEEFESDIQPEIDIDQWNELLTKALQEAGELYIPKTKPSNKPQKLWYWNKKCEDIRNQINRVNKLIKNTKVITPSLTALRRQLVKQAKTIYLDSQREAWGKICQSLSLESNDSVVWQRIRYIYSKGHRPIPTPFADPKQKAEDLAAQFANRSSFANFDQESVDHLHQVNDKRSHHITQALTEQDPETDQDFTTGEFLKANNTCKNRSAPGEDAIPYAMLKNAGPIAKAHILHMYNKSYRIRKLPKKWKTAQQIPLPKPHDKTQFRPISLLTTMSKNLERIIHDRLIAKTQNKFHPNLIGFRNKRGTTDGLATLAAHASQTIFGDNYTVGRKCFAVFVDLEKAFEMANATVILYQLTKLGVKGNLLAWIQDYLKDRKGTVKIQDATSQEYLFENGTPQGSVLSPFLYNVLINALLNYKFPSQIKVISYADDILMVSNTTRVVFLQKALKILTKACADLGLKINVNKTKAMIFSKGAIQKLPKLYINGQQLEFVRSFKYLGIIFQSNYSFTKHLAYIKQKFSRKFSILKMLAGASWGTSIQSLITYYKGAIRPVIEYGAQIFINSKTYFRQQLETMQRRCLRLIFRARYHTYGDYLLLEAGITPIYTRIKTLACKWYVKTACSQLPHVLHPIMTKIHAKNQPVPPDHAILMNVIHNEFIQMDNINTLEYKDQLANQDYPSQYDKDNPPPSPILFEPILADLPNTSSIEFSPWEPLPPNLSIEIKTLPKAKAELTTDELKFAAATHELDIEIYLARNSGAMALYTDASTNSASMKAAFAIVPYHGNKFHINESKVYQADYGLSIMTLEMAALHKALLTIQQNYYLYDNIIICTDALSAIHAFIQAPIQDNIELITNMRNILTSLHEKNINIRIKWTPSHIGIRGNELADYYASHATSAATHMDYEHTLSIETASVPISLSSLYARIKDYFTQNAFGTLMGPIQDSDDLDKIRPYPITKKFRKFRNILNFNTTNLVQYLRIKFDAEHYCMYHHETYCQYCDAPFSTKHYLLDCPATYLYRQEIIQLCPQKYWDESIVNRIRMLIDTVYTDSSPFKDLLDKQPPNWYCLHEHKQVYDVADFDCTDKYQVPRM